MSSPISPARSVSASHATRLAFFGQPVVIRSDSGPFIQRVNQMYGHLRTEDGPLAAPAWEYAVLTRPDNPWGEKVVILQGEVWPLADPALFDWYAHEGFVMDLYRRLRTHLLIHAGVVAHRGRAIVLVGESTFGKTTLVLELVRRGLSYLSDELAGLSRVDGLVHPFPRSPRIRAGTLELLGITSPPAGAVHWQDKTIVNIGDLYPGRLGRAAPLGHLVVLHDGDRRHPGQGPLDQKLRFFLDRLPPSLLSSLEGHGAIRQVTGQTGRGYAVLEVETPNKLVARQLVESLCQQQRVLVLNMQQRSEHHPDFQGEVALESVPPSAVLPTLLQQFQPGHQSAIVQDDLQKRPVQILWELAGSIGEARCHRLSVGSLEAMADAICSLA